jgi:hypothetical protein
MMTDKLEKIRVTSRQYGNRPSIELSNLTEKEADDIEAMTLGSCWLRVSEEGRIERLERFIQPPPPSEDPKYPPKWIPLEDWSKHAPFLCSPVPPLPEEPRNEYDYPSITIHGLCGYNNTPYDYEARKLQDFGFECLRSRRGQDGKFWELWYLSSTCCAKGELKEAIDAADKKGAKYREKAKITAAVDFLCRRVSFGALDVCYQRAAMVID